VTAATERNQATERNRPPLTGDERTLLTGFLDYHRATLRVTCAGLSDVDSHRAMLSSPLRTAIGLVTHLRWDEHFWCEVVLAGRENRAPTEPNGSNEPTGPGTGFKVQDGTTLEQALSDYERQCAISRQIVDGLDLGHEVGWHDRTVSVRWVLIRLIEETARHNGHLDAIRELIDGANG
jgi:uncharacterized protein DUF664